MLITGSARVFKYVLTNFKFLAIDTKIVHYALFPKQHFELSSTPTVIFLYCKCKITDGNWRLRSS